MNRQMRTGIIVLVVVAASAALYFGWQGLNQLMFKNNPVYTIRHVPITTQFAASQDMIRRATGIDKGVNLFSFSAARKREELLRNFPNLDDVKIVKRLPDTVEIIAIDRLPVLRIAATNFATDSKGTIMAIDESQRRRWASLPILMDGNRAIRVDPGSRLSGKYAAALDLINVVNEMDGISFRIERIDVGGRVYLILQTADTQREIRLVWEELQSKDDIRLALRIASESLAQPKAATLIRFDVLLYTMSVYGI